MPTGLTMPPMPPSLRPTLRYIIENIKPQKLSNTCLTAFKPIQDIMFLGLTKTTLYEDVTKMCLLNFTYKQTVLANKMMETLILYGVVNAYSVFLYLEIIDKGLDDITYEELIAKFNTTVAVYVSPIVPATLQYLQEFVVKGYDNPSNKEMLTRIPFGNIIQDNFLRGTVGPQDVGLDRLTVGGLTQSSIDAVTDKFYRLIGPYLSAEEIVDYFSDTYKLIYYFFPASLAYFTEHAPPILGIPIPPYVPNYPPTDDIHLHNFCYDLEPDQSPGEESTGLIYFALFGLNPDEPVV